MRRAAQGLAVLTVGGALFLAPDVAADAAPVAPATAPVLAQAPPTDTPPPAPELDGSPTSSQDGYTDQQRYTIGAIGAGLIGLVLLSRRLRKKPVFGISWPKKSS